jgi:hypothetical protein
MRETRLILLIITMFTMLGCASTTPATHVKTGYAPKAREAPRLDNVPKPKYSKTIMDNVDIFRSMNFKKWRGLYNCVLAFDKSYQSVTYDYVIEYTEWFNNIVWYFGLNEIKGQYDCDNVAQLYKAVMATSVYKKHSDHEILVGFLIVSQKNDFGRIPGYGDSNKIILHALNIAHTEKGWIVIEPQTGVIVPLKDYPNKDYIQRIIL